MGKEQGQNASSDQDRQNQATADRMAANLKKMGYEDADAKCLKGLVDTLSVTGGNNGNYSSCWTKPDPHDIGVRMDEARRKFYRG